MKFIAVQDHGGQAPIPCLVCVPVSKRGSEGVRSEREVEMEGEGRSKGKKRGAERREEEGRGWKGPREKKEICGGVRKGEK